MKTFPGRPSVSRIFLFLDSMPHLTLVVDNGAGLSDWYQPFQTVQKGGENIPMSTNYIQNWKSLGQECPPVLSFRRQR